MEKLTIEIVRKHARTFPLFDLAAIADIDKSAICKFRAGKVGLNGKNMLSLIIAMYDIDFKLKKTL